jgi:hypothetical protein
MPEEEFRRKVICQWRALEWLEEGSWFEAMASNIMEILDRNLSIRLTHALANL